jgi:hypothetical protein
VSREATDRQRAVYRATSELVGVETTVEQVGSVEQFARRVERWRANGLDPLLPGEPAEDARHYLALAELSGRGTVADITAISLARRGFACRRLAKVLEGFAQSALASYGHLSDPYGAGTEATFELAERLDAMASTDPNIIGRFLREMRRKIGRSSGESEIGFATVLGDLAATLLGGRPIEADLASQALGFPAEKGAADEPAWKEPPGTPLLVSYVEAVRHDLTTVVALVPLTEYVWRFLFGQLGVAASDDDLGCLAVVTAPIVASLARKVLPVLRVLRADGTTRSDVAVGSFLQLALSASPAADPPEAVVSEVQSAVDAASTNLAAHLDQLASGGQVVPGS